MSWAELEAPLDAQPEFLVQAPDGKKDWSEIQRQVEFRRLMRMAAPRVLVYANPNAGKRNPMQAKREGIMAGVFDLSIEFRAPLRALVEMKGYRQRRPGSLTQSQIDYGNRMTQLGWSVACFFCPLAAVDWLRGLGFPIAQVQHG